MKPQYTTQGARPFQAPKPFITNKSVIPQKNPDEGLIQTLFINAEEGNIFKLKEFIISNNMTLYAKNEKGESVLHGVIRSTTLTPTDKLDVIKFLISRGAPVMAFDNQNITPLHLACKYQLADVVDLLLEKGADINVQDNQQMTPLHYLVQGYTTECKSIKNLKPKDLIKQEPRENIVPVDENIKLLNKDLTDYLYKSPLLNSYLKHIRKYINISDVLFPELIDKIVDNNNVEMAKILKDPKITEQDKVNKLSSLVSGIKNNIDKELNTQYKKNTSDINFNPNTINGDGPDGETLQVNKIIPENGTQILTKLRDKTFSSTDTIFDGLRGEFGKTKNDLSNLKNNIINVKQYISNIIRLNEAAKININIDQKYVLSAPPANEMAYIPNNELMPILTETRDNMGSQLIGEIASLNLNSRHDLIHDITNDGDILLPNELEIGPITELKKELTNDLVFRKPDVYNYIHLWAYVNGGYEFVENELHDTTYYTNKDNMDDKANKKTNNIRNTIFAIYGARKSDLVQICNKYRLVDQNIVDKALEYKNTNLFIMALHSIAKAIGNQQIINELNSIPAETIINILNEVDKLANTELPAKMPSHEKIKNLITDISKMRGLRLIDAAMIATHTELVARNHNNIIISASLAFMAARQTNPIPAIAAAPVAGVNSTIAAISGGRTLANVPDPAQPLGTQANSAYITAHAMVLAGSALLAIKQPYEDIFQTMYTLCNYGAGPAPVPVPVPVPIRQVPKKIFSSIAKVALEQIDIMGLDIVLESYPINRMDEAIKNIYDTLSYDPTINQSIGNRLCQISLSNIKNSSIISSVFYAIANRDPRYTMLESAYASLTSILLPRPLTVPILAGHRSEQLIFKAIQTEINKHLPLKNENIMTALAVCAFVLTLNMIPNAYIPPVVSTLENINIELARVCGKYTDEVLTKYEILTNMAKYSINTMDLIIPNDITLENTISYGEHAARASLELFSKIYEVTKPLLTVVPMLENNIINNIAIISACAGVAHAAAALNNYCVAANGYPKYLNNAISIPKIKQACIHVALQLHSKSVPNNTIAVDDITNISALNITNNDSSTNAGVIVESLIPKLGIPLPSQLVYSDRSAAGGAAPAPVPVPPNYVYALFTPSSPLDITANDMYTVIANKTKQWRIPNKLTILSYPIHYVKEIIKSFNVMLPYIDKMEKQIDNNHYYHVYTVMIPMMVAYICNIMLNMINLRYELKTNVIPRYTDLKTLFSELHQKFITQPHSYYLDLAAKQSGESNTKINSIITEIESIYNKDLKNTIGKINELIKNINNRCSVQYIMSFHKNNSNIALTTQKFMDINSGEIKYIFDKQLTELEGLPSLDKLAEQFTKFINPGDSVARLNAKKKMYEDYYPQINKDTYTKYIRDNIDTDIAVAGQRLGSIADKIKFNVLDKDDKIITYVGGQFIVPNINIPKIGYLLPDGYTFATVLGGTLLPSLKYGNNSIAGILDTTSANIGKVGTGNPIAPQKDSNEIILPILTYNVTSHIQIIKIEFIKFILTVMKNIIDRNIDVPVSGEPAPIPNGRPDNRFTNEQNIIKYVNFIKSNIHSNTGDHSLFYTIIANMVDNIISTFIKVQINGFATKKSLDILKVLEKQPLYEKILQILKQPGMINGDEKTVPQKKDYGFNLRLNGIIEDVSSHISNNDNASYQLNFTSLILDEENPDFTSIHPMYNYSFTSQTLENKCYKTEPKIIDKLINNRARINVKDLVGQSPIFYGIELQNTDVIDKLLAHDATVYTESSRNKMGVTPLVFTLNMFKAHLDILAKDNNIMTSLTTPIYEQIKKSIRENSSFKNNILRYSDIILPFIIILINNYFYSKMRNYTNGWSYDKMENLIKDISKDGDVIVDNKIQLVNISDDNLVNIGLRGSSVLKDMNSNNAKENNKNIKTLEEINEQIKSLTAEKSKIYVDSTQLKRVAEIDNLLNALAIEQTRLTNIININTTNQTTNNDLSKIISDRETTNIKDRMTRFNKTSSSSNILSVYNDIFMKVVNNISSEKIDGETVNEYSAASTDMRTYSGLWHMYLVDNNKLNSVSNIHLIMLKHQNKTITEYLTNPTKESLNELNNSLSLTIDANEVMKNLCKIYLEMSSDMKDNFVLKDIMDMMAHVMKHTLITAYYNTIVKSISAYVTSMNPYSADVYGDNEAGKTLHSKFVSDIIENIINTGKDFNKNGTTYHRSELLHYLLDIMPMKLLKVNFAIYDDDYDTDKNIKIDEIYDRITNILMSNTTIPLNTESSLISNLSNIIKPFFMEYNKIFMDQMRNMVNGYLQYIVSGSKMLDMTAKLTKKSVEELVK